VKVLISHGADPLAEFGEKTPVEFARAVDQKEVYKYLKDVVKERQKSRSTRPSSPTSQKPTTTTPTRASRKQKVPMILTCVFLTPREASVYVMSIDMYLYKLYLRKPGL